ncbi:beta-ketoacyl-[acyl-carrier-protein] synthase family protein [Geobacter sp. SVR]|uniref:beta-ketoacyl-[acyl-carrier-protein] synthase family protein n=1 Tax=Geobacter sp. SVR TaxID=2495594 RepID=UPI00143EF7FF|nr:beta-ketoacyl-[acyl-carrier-protein] synthase family protein [Geobacter sp. SVR]BCS54296.1 beta-ketoacyl synthase [Geobacter sp. SVR]GCF85845.1 beta-ketoacyl synthase [Geobacter sp. SVR]
MSARRVVITGLGVFCGAAKSAAEFGEVLSSGRSGIGSLDLFDVSPFPARIGSQVKRYDPLDHFSRRESRRLSRSDQFGVIAAGEALRDSGVLGLYSPYDMGVSIGGGAAGMFQGEAWLKAALEGREERPSLLRGILPDQTTTDIARIYRLGGYQGTITTACSSSATAIGWGADLIACGRQKVVVAGGVDTLSLLTFAGFNSLKVVDPEPCAPFSLGRQGISLGEGAAFMVLEDEADALARGARIYGAVLGYALAGEAHHMTAPEPTGAMAARVMRRALELAAVDPLLVGWVNAHGTGTPLNDVVESNAMKLVFGQRAPQVPLVSTKSVTGHCLGAAGAIEAVATVISLNKGLIPQTLNFRGFDPECDLEYCHAGSKISDCRIAMSNSFAFGGNITSLVLSL